MKKLLILSATAGAGHLRAADALVKTAEHLQLPVTIEHRDILEFTVPVFRKVYSEVTNKISGHAPELWGYIYKKTQQKGLPKPKHPLLKILDKYHFKKYLKFIEEYKPDAVICTHFLPYIAIADEMKKSSWRIPFYSIPTDYDVHSLWISPYITQYYCATDEAAWTIQSHGIAPENITATGIPVHPEFATIKSKTKARNELGLEPKRFTIMILSGGYGIGVIDQLVPSVLEFLSTFKNKKFTVITVCGKNKTLYDTLAKIKPPSSIAFKPFGFVSNIHDMMDASDVLITKSGGLTVTEALSKHLPMILFDPILGQEGRNADYLTEKGTALRGASFANLNFKLLELINHPETLVRLSKNASLIAKPDAGKVILKSILRQPERKYLEINSSLIYYLC